MSDITMCYGKGCNIKKHCYRFTANKNEYAKSYFLESPKKITDDECEYFAGTSDYYRAIADKPEELKKRIEINNKKNLPSNTMPF